MQPISILLAFFVGYLTLLTMTYALAVNTNQENQPSVADARLKRFYDFGSRSIHDNEDVDEVNDEFNRLRRFYDFGTKKRFYDFGSKKRSSE